MIEQDRDTATLSDLGSGRNLEVSVLGGSGRESGRRFCAEGVAVARTLQIVSQAYPKMFIGFQVAAFGPFVPSVYKNEAFLWR